MKARTVLAFCAAATLLAGCCKSHTPEAKLTFTAPHSGTVVLNITKTALAGETLITSHSFTLNPDCTLRGFATLRLITPPTHGIVEIVKRRDYPNYAGTNSRAACNKKKAHGIFADYTPDDDYTGPDYFVVEDIGLGGEDTLLKYTIAVK